MVRTTVVLEDGLFNKVKRLAVDNRASFRRTVTDLLSLALRKQKPVKKAGKLRFRTFRCGESSVPIHDRNALFDRMDART